MNTRFCCMHWLRSFTLATAGLAMATCSAPQSENRTGCTEIGIAYAKGFRLNKCPGGFELRLTGGESYWLSSDAHPSEKHQGMPHITVPVKRVVCTSTTQLPWFSELKASEVVVGFSDPDRIYSQELRNASISGKLQAVSRAGGLDEESIFLLGPDLLLADQGVQVSTRLSKRIPVIRTADFSESHPLGRAEWIRLAGILTGRITEADSFFHAVETNYQRLKSMGKSNYAPVVLTGIPYGGTWYMPGADSYLTRLFADAGFRYPYADREGVSIPLGLESVVAEGQAIDLWIGTGHWTSVQDALDSDQRLRNIAAVVRGNLFAYDAQTTAAGGNAYFEEAVIRPDLLLSDLVNIRLQQPVRLRYYRKLPERPE